MQTPDLINGLFELFGGLLNWMNVWKIYKDKTLRGVLWYPTLLFAVWGFWNLFYYPHLEQWLSFFGGLVIVAGNSVWVFLAVRYTIKNHSKM